MTNLEKFLKKNDECVKAGDSACHDDPPSGWTDNLEKSTQIIRVMMEDLEIITTADYVNEYDENKKFIRALYPSDIAARALNEADAIARGEG